MTSADAETVTDGKSLEARPAEGRGLSGWMLDEFRRPGGIANLGPCQVEEGHHRE